VYISARNAQVCGDWAKELSTIGECVGIPAELSKMEEIDRLRDELSKRANRALRRLVQVDRAETTTFVELSAPNLMRGLMFGRAKFQERPKPHLQVVNAL
jgi:hypothetical protein